VPDGNVGVKVQVDNAIRAINQKKPVPEIDFTLHTMEDGTQVSTLERVCKGTSPPFERMLFPCIALTMAATRCASTCHAPPDR